MGSLLILQAEIGAWRHFLHLESPSNYMLRHCSRARIPDCGGVWMVIGKCHFGASFVENGDRGRLVVEMSRMSCHSLEKCRRYATQCLAVDSRLGFAAYLISRERHGFAGGLAWYLA